MASKKSSSNQEASSSQEDQKDNKEEWVTVGRKQHNPHQRKRTDYGWDQTTGRRAEARFAELADSQGIFVRHASDDEDYHDHYDCIIRSARGALQKVDVKSVKKLQRKHLQAIDGYVWLELWGDGIPPAPFSDHVTDEATATYAAEGGWVRVGKADLIAFERANGFDCVLRSALVPIVDAVIKAGDVVYECDAPQSMVGKIYIRSDGTRGACTLVKRTSLPIVKSLVSVVRK